MPHLAGPDRTPYFMGSAMAVHAKQNALLAAARFGIAVEGATRYNTVRTCFGCTKEMLQVGIHKVHDLQDGVHPDADAQRQYDVLQARVAGGIDRLETAEPEAPCASCMGAATGDVPDEHGHQ